jgi:Na+/melibiose symporter-like transporter
VVFAALIGVVLSSALTKAQMDSFGCRIPLLVGCLIMPFLFLLRRSLAESDEFLTRRQRPSTRKILASSGANRKLVVQGTMLVTMTTVSFYMITTYTPTFGRSVLHRTDRDSLIVTLCVGISNFSWLPLSVALSDRIGRTPILICCSLPGLLTAYPALTWAVASPSFERLQLVELWLSLIYGGYNGEYYFVCVTATFLKTAVSSVSALCDETASPT